MCKWIKQSSVALALLMNLLVPSRFAATSICNLSFLQPHASQCRKGEFKNEQPSFIAPLQKNRITARDFSFVAGLEVGNDSLAALLGRPIRLQGCLPVEQIAENYIVARSLQRSDILTLHSRLNI